MVSMPGSSQRGLRSQCSQKTKRGEAKERGARSSASDSEHRPSGLPTEDAAVAAGDRAGHGAGARALTARGRPAAGAVHRREATGLRNPSRETSACTPGFCTGAEGDQLWEMASAERDLAAEHPRRLQARQVPRLCGFLRLCFGLRQVVAHRAHPPGAKLAAPIGCPLGNDPGGRRVHGVCAAHAAHAPGPASQDGPDFFDRSQGSALPGFRLFLSVPSETVSHAIPAALVLKCAGSPCRVEERGRGRVRQSTKKRNSLPSLPPSPRCGWPGSCRVDPRLFFSAQERRPGRRKAAFSNAKPFSPAPPAF